MRPFRSILWLGIIKGVPILTRSWVFFFNTFNKSFAYHFVILFWLIRSLKIRLFLKIIVHIFIVYVLACVLRTRTIRFVNWVLITKYLSMTLNLSFSSVRHWLLYFIPVFTILSDQLNKLNLFFIVPNVFTLFLNFRGD